jgi:hypothetical protein
MICTPPSQRALRAATRCYGWAAPSLDLGQHRARGLAIGPTPHRPGQGSAQTTDRLRTKASYSAHVCTRPLHHNQSLLGDADRSGESVLGSVCLAGGEGRQRTSCSDSWAQPSHLPRLSHRVIQILATPVGIASGSNSGCCPWDLLDGARHVWADATRRLQARHLRTDRWRKGTVTAVTHDDFEP